MSTEIPPPMGPPFRVHELSDTGVLWLINKVVFHPRGFALALLGDENEQICGWHIQGDGTEPWSFSGDIDDQRFRALQAFLDKHRPGGEYHA